MMFLSGFILGTILGSFAKALADRSLEEKSFLGRSYCPHCKKKLSILDLIPILSYIFLKGRCRYCKKKIGKEYIFVELIMGFLIGFLFWKTGVFSPLLFFQAFFITILVTVFITDIKKMFIPDRVILPSAVLAFIFLCFYGNFLIPAVSGLILAGFFLSLIIITKGRGMGGGDVKLALFLGLGLSFPNILLALLIATFSGSIVGLLLIFFKKKHLGDAIAFGPFLVLGSLIALFWGTEIISWYNQFV